MSMVRFHCHPPSRFPHAWLVTMKGTTTAPRCCVATLPWREGVIKPEAYAEHAARWVRDGCAIVGGCCAIGPPHIAAVAARVAAAGAQRAG